MVRSYQAFLSIRACSRPAPGRPRWRRERGQIHRVSGGCAGCQIRLSVSSISNFLHPCPWPCPPMQIHVHANGNAKHTSANAPSPVSVPIPVTSHLPRKAGRCLAAMPPAWSPLHFVQDQVGSVGLHPVSRRSLHASCHTVPCHAMPCDAVLPIFAQGQAASGCYRVGRSIASDRVSPYLPTFTGYLTSLPPVQTCHGPPLVTVRNGYYDYVLGAPGR